MSIYHANADKNDLVIYIDKANQVTEVPYYWKRKLINNKIVYITPSKEVINTVEQLNSYLLSDGSCKCGLSCPFFIEEVFNFDPFVESVENHWLNSIDETKLSCKHRHRQRSNQTTTNYDQSKLIYTNVSNNSSSINLNDQTRLVAIQNPLNSNKASSYQPITIQPILNFKQPQTQQDQTTVAYIPIKKENLANLNLQQFFLTSPIKASSTDSTQIYQILNSSMIQPAVVAMQKSKNN